MGGCAKGGAPTLPAYCWLAPMVYPWRTCLVPVSYMSRTPHVDRDPHGVYKTGTRQVRDRYTMDTPSNLASRMGGVSACPPSHAHASSQARLLQTIGLQGSSTGATPRHAPIGACPQPAAPPPTWFSVSQICQPLPPSLRAQADFLTELPRGSFRNRRNLTFSGEMYVLQAAVFLENPAAGTKNEMLTRQAQFQVLQFDSNSGLG